MINRILIDKGKYKMLGRLILGFLEISLYFNADLGYNYKDIPSYNMLS